MNKVKTFMSIFFIVLGAVASAILSGGLFGISMGFFNEVRYVEPNHIISNIEWILGFISVFYLINLAWEKAWGLFK